MKDGKAIAYEQTADELKTLREVCGMSGLDGIRSTSIFTASAQVCCRQWDTCVVPCTPRGTHMACATIQRLEAENARLKELLERRQNEVAYLRGHLADIDALLQSGKE